jgi:hypothetical protein
MAAHNNNINVNKMTHVFKTTYCDVYVVHITNKTGSSSDDSDLLAVSYTLTLAYKSHSALAYLHTL